MEEKGGSVYEKDKMLIRNCVIKTKKFIIGYDVRNSRKFNNFSNEKSQGIGVRSKNFNI